MHGYGVPCVPKTWDWDCGWLWLKVNAALEEFVCIAHQNLHLQIEQSLPHPQTPWMNTPPQARPCVVHPQTKLTTNSCPLWVQSQRSYAEVPHSSRVWRPLVHRSWLPSPPFRCLPHLPVNPTSRPSADPKLGMRWIHGSWPELLYVYIHMLSWCPRINPEPFNFLVMAGALQLSNAKRVRIEGATNPHWSLPRMNERGRYSRRLWDPITSRCGRGVAGFLQFIESPFS